jgi:glycosyltransferase involved in cell wall biosynthesis
MAREQRPDRTEAADRMRLALVTPSFVPRSGSLERHVDALARGLALRGVDVEVVTQDPLVRSPWVSHDDGVVIRRFPTTIGSPRHAMAPALWEYVRRTARSWDIVHVHASRRSLGLAVSGTASRRLVFTPHAPIQRLARWPYVAMARAVIERAAHTVPLSGVEAELIRRTFPRAANRVRAVPVGVDRVEIQRAAPFEHPGLVVLAVGCVERCERVERTIAAMAGLDDRFRLVIVGDGPAIRRLRRYAADLRVSERVDFVGAVSVAVLYRWLRTARVLVTLSDADASALSLLEALTAGASAVASDVPVHREAAAFTAGAGVRFVDPHCSPLQLADAIADVAERPLPASATLKIPSAAGVVESMLALYGSLGRFQAAPSRTFAVAEER